MLGLELYESAAPSVVLWDFLPQPRTHSVSGASLAACS